MSEKVIGKEFLKGDNITLAFGGVVAIMDVSFTVYEGEIFSIIGPNGAGKSSMFNVISGFYKPQKGKIIYKGEDITKLSPHQIAKKGIARTFQNLELFKGMTVLENLMLGRHIHIHNNLINDIFWFGKARRTEVEHRRLVEDIIDFLEIESYRKKPVGMLPYGIQKRVELGRALALQGDLILLDEPMAGMNLEETEDMARFIIDINYEWKKTIILIEHDMGVVMDLSDRVMVLNFGEKITEGNPDEVSKHPEVVTAYLGGEEGEFLGR
jgi:branched-chain amino acid transport system ATP-binding protein